MAQPSERWSLMPEAFTKVSLPAVDDAASGPGWRPLGSSGCARRPGCGAHGVTLFPLLPGKRSPFPYRHTDAKEIYVVLSGSAGQARRRALADASHKAAQEAGRSGYV